MVSICWVCSPNGGSFLTWPDVKDKTIFQTFFKCPSCKPGWPNGHYQAINCYFDHYHKIFPIDRERCWTTGYVNRSVRTKLILFEIPGMRSKMPDIHNSGSKMTVKMKGFEEVARYVTNSGSTAGHGDDDRWWSSDQVMMMIQLKSYQSCKLLFLNYILINILLSYMISQNPFVHLLLVVWFTLIRLENIRDLLTTDIFWACIHKYSSFHVWKSILY